MATLVIRAVVFDLGGVLLDWNPRYVYRPYFDTSEQIDDFLAEIDFPSWNMQQDRGRPFAEGVAALSAKYPHYARLIRLYHEHWETPLPGPLRRLCTSPAPSKLRAIPSLP